MTANRHLWIQWPEFPQIYSAIRRQATVLRKLHIKYNYPRDVVFAKFYYVVASVIKYPSL